MTSLGAPSGTSLTRFVLGVLCVLLIIGGLAATQSVEADAPLRSGSDVRGAANSQEAPAGPAGSAGDSGAPAPVAAGEASAAVASENGDASVENGAPGVAAAEAVDGPWPAPGAYVYAWSRAGAPDGATSGEYTTVVTDRGEADGGRRQAIRHESGDSSAIDNVLWDDDGMSVTTTTYLARGQEGTCDWRPAFAKVAMPLERGRKWSYETSCAATFEGGTVAIERSGEFAVVGKERIDVSGESVDVWKIEGAEDLVYPSYSQRTETTAFFSPRHGLIVKSSAATRATEPWQTGTVTEHVEITNLSPR